MLPRTVRDRLRERVRARAAPHQRDLARGPGARRPAGRPGGQVPPAGNSCSPSANRPATRVLARGSGLTRAVRRSTSLGSQRGESGTKDTRFYCASASISRSDAANRSVRGSSRDRSGTRVERERTALTRRLTLRSHQAASYNPIFSFRRVEAIRSEALTTSRDSYLHYCP
jgi:hypothetical protein